MNTAKTLAAVVAALLVSLLNASAGNEFQLTFRGVCYLTNGAGRMVPTPITEQSLLQGIAQNAGITDLSTLQLVYHEQGNAMGDTIDVINPATRVVLDTIFGFYFGEDFNRQALHGRNDAWQKRVDYIYTKQNDHSLGAGLVNKAYATNRNGTVRTTINGQIQYVVTSDGTNSPQMCNVNFHTGRQLMFTNAPSP